MEAKIDPRWTTVVTVVVFVGGALGALALGEPTLATALGSYAAGLVTPTRGRVTS